MAALQGLMGGDPSAIGKAMSDPEVGPVLQKLMAKMGPAMGGMGGMPGKYTVVNVPRDSSMPQ